MPADAFTGGVKPGGLNSVNEIRILLCYLIKTIGPFSQDILEEALIREELVNYFELFSALEDLENSGLAINENGLYRITPKGSSVADSLMDDVPLSVRDSAVRAVIRTQAWKRREAQNKATVMQENGGYTVQCSIQDSAGEAFGLTLSMPDEITAEAVRRRFVEDGSKLYALLLNFLTEQPLDL